MTDTRIVFLCLVMATSACSGKDSGGARESAHDKAQSTAPQTTTDAASEWRNFEDGFLRLSHPKNRQLLAVSPKGDIAHGYLISEPDGDVSVPGPETTSIINASPKEFRNPREMIEDSVRGLANASGRLLNRQRITLVKGSCMRIDFEVPMLGQCPAPDGGTADCYQVVLSAVCQTPAGVLMEINSRTQGYPAGKPDARAQEQIKFFDRFLKGMEFK